ncbi:hypothetical protein OG698_39595 [Streptomyces sp. NBC_01003]|uniref:hypothetical protein n=1 Tax=unclassified Streptomyces TaxID=2593676 RepID=UPI002DD82155|nr:hypothetical protein [Streptomyces sp. NBC_01445]WSE08959.1 hypothetical protein OG574_39705 [Streptomyces sp. NBC_01445]WSW28816.1 hypothetical protein OG698_39595 [Streptomyces sp. NBC_01003]
MPPDHNHGCPIHDDRLPLLSLDEAHALLDVLAGTAERDDELRDDAAWLLAEHAARVPSREDEINGN